VRPAGATAAATAAAAAALVALGLPHAAGAATTPVSTPAQLQQAVGNASPGDTIVVAPGNYAISAPLTVMVTNLTIKGPQSGPGVVISGAVDAQGTQDLVDVNAGASATIENVEFRLTSSGAGASILVDGTLDLENSAAQQNTNTFLRTDSGGTAVVRNSTITGGLQGGGGVSSAGDVQLYNDTIVANSGGGVFMDGGSVEATNTIIADNPGGDCPAGALTTTVASLDSDGSCGVVYSHVNPRVNTLALNGGSTFSFQPKPGSPAIDAGSNAGSDCPPVDQRYALRNDGHCDIGSIEITDKQPPVITVPGDLTAEATGPTGAAVSYAASATDNSGTVSTFGCSPVSGSTFPFGTTTVTCTATDPTGNTATASFHVTVRDTTPPVVTVPADITDTTNSITKVETFTASATDAIDGTDPVTCAPASGSAFPLGTTTVHCSATDAHGNTGSASFTVTISTGLDTTPPVVTVPPDITAEATSAAGAVVGYTASATDNVGVTSFGCAPASGSTFPLGTTTVTCTASDGSGNVAHGSFHVTVQDTTPPVVTVPADITREATGAPGAVVGYTATATDNVGVTSFACSPASGSTFPLGTTTVACTAGDAAGNTAHASFHVTVRDTTPPLVAVPADITAEATGAAGAAVGYTATATDTVDGPDPVLCSPAAGATFPLGTTTVECTATDAAGNSSRASFHVTVQDTTPPVISNVPADITVTNGAGVTYAAPTAVDAVDGPVPVGCAPPSGSTFVATATTVTCTATDAHGNRSMATFQVLVAAAAPQIQVPADITQEATSPAGANVGYTVTATPGGGGAPVTDLACTPTSGSVFPFGTTRVTCTATDASHTSAQRSFSVTVRDTTPPVISGVPPNIATSTLDPNGAVVSYPLPTATDSVDGAVPVSCSPPPGSRFKGTTTVTCSAYDAHGNGTSASFAVTVVIDVDHTPPFIAVPTQTKAEATRPDGAVVNYIATAVDGHDGVVPAMCTPPPGAVFPLGATLVTCTASDASGNVAHATFVETVVDTTKPVLKVPADFSAKAGQRGGAAVTYQVTATDAVGVAHQACTPASGSIFPLGVTTVTCTASDAAGNRATASFRVTVTDTTPPFFNDPLPHIVARAASIAGVQVTFSSPKAFDLVDGPEPSTCVPASRSTFSIGTTLVTCSSSDRSGNTASITFDVIVRPPLPGTPVVVLNVPAKPVVAEATGPKGGAVTYPVSAVGTPSAPSCVPASGSTFPLGTTGVRCSLARSGRPPLVKTFAVRVVDTTPPELDSSLEGVVVARRGGADVVLYTLPGATDAVDGTVPVRCNPAPGGVLAAGTATIRCTATDAHGNRASTSYPIPGRTAAPGAQRPRLDERPGRAR
jgi:hypothetical protein